MEWLNIEIHPETPRQGRSIKELFPASSVEGMYGHLNEMGKQYGINFSANDRLSNSRLSILLGEYIHLNTPEHEDNYHDAIFRAYFSEGRNIGDQEVLSELLQQMGMSADALSRALHDPASEDRMRENSQSAHRLGVTGTPTFFIGKERVVGAQPYPNLLLAARRALGLTPNNPNDLHML